MKKTITLLILTILLLSICACGKYGSKYKAVGFVHSNESTSASMSFSSFEGIMVFKLKSANEGDIKFHAKMESGSATVYYDVYGNKLKLFSINGGEELNSHEGYVDSGTVYVIVETEGECKNGDFCFDLNYGGDMFIDQSDTKEDAWRSETDLRKKFPEYYDLSTFKGLEVYVWQMAPESYSFGVMAGTNREKTLEELWNLKGATAVEMRDILSSYDIPQEDIAIIPWQNPISSYIGEYWIREKNEAPEVTAKREQEYIERIRSLLFDSDAETEGALLLKEGAIKNASITSLPEGYAYSFDGEAAERITDYISELNLITDFPENPNEYAGMTWVISLQYETGDVLTIYHFGNLFIRAEDGPWYKMTYEEANRFSELLNELNN